LGKSGVVVRIALGVGFAKRPGTNALFNSLSKRWAAGEMVALPTYEYRNPIDATTLGRFMIELVKNSEAHGIFHVGCREPISRYELGLQLAARMGYSGKVEPQWEPVPGRAPRGLHHHLLTEKLRATSTIPIPSCDQAIARCFDELA
jgi:dTDP-4-dehydrorhamnose reductase